MKNLRHDICLHLGILVGTLLCATSGVFAFSVKPGVQVVTVQAGKQTKVLYDVSNDDDKPKKMILRLQNSFVLAENKKYPVDTWLVPQETSFEVPAHGSRTITMNVTVPKETKGELAGVLSFEPLPVPATDDKEKKAKFQTQFIPVISVSLYVRAQGTEEGSAELGPVKVRNVAAHSGSSPEIEAIVNVKNTGNIHQRPSSHFDIFKKGATTPIMTLSVPSGWPVMPRADIDYTAQTLGQIPPGDYDMVTEVTFGTVAKMHRKDSFTIDTFGITKDLKEITEPK